MKVKFFIAGMRTGIFFASSLPYAFAAGLIQGFVVYGGAMMKQIEQVDTRNAWQKRAEDASFKPEGPK